MTFPTPALRFAVWVAPAVRLRKHVVIGLGGLLGVSALGAALLRPQFAERSDEHRLLGWLAAAPAYALIVLLGIMLGVRVVRMRRRFAIEESAGGAALQHPRRNPDDDRPSPAPPAGALAALLATELARVRELYATVDDRPIDPETAGPEARVDKGEFLTPEPRLPTIQTADPSALLEPAIAGGAKVTVWKLEIPVGMILSLFNRVTVSNRIVIGVHRDGTGLILDARLLGGERSGSWRVRRELEPGDDGTSELPEMIAELAELIFCELSVVGSVTAPAARAFLQGLRSYRESRGVPEEAPIHLRRATRWFREAAGTDPGFHLAHYNLGLVYSARNRRDSAERCFDKAVQRDSARAEPYYALALIRYERGREAEKAARGAPDAAALHLEAAERHYHATIGFCERIIALKPKIRTTAARTHDIKGIAERRISELRSTADLPDRQYLRYAIASRKRAVAIARRELVKREWSLAAESPLGHTRLQVTRTLAGGLMMNLAIGLARRALKRRDEQRRRKAARDFRRSVRLLREAARLRPDDAVLRFELGKVHESIAEGLRGRRARRQLERAAGRYTSAGRIAQLPSYWARAAVVNSLLGRPDRTRAAAARALESPPPSDEETPKLVADALLDAGDAGGADRVRAWSSAASVSESGRDRDSETLLATSPALPPRERGLALVRLAGSHREQGSAEAELERKLAEGRSADAASRPRTSRDPDLLVRLGRLRQARGQTAEAFAVAMKALDLDPLSFAARSLVGDLYAAQEDWVSASEAWESAILCRPASDRDRASARESIGAAYWHRARASRRAPERDDLLDRAVTSFERAFDLTPEGDLDSRVRYHHWLGRLHLERGVDGREQAVRHLRIAEAVRPECLVPTLFLGKACLSDGLYDEAEDRFSAVITQADQFREAGRSNEDRPASRFEDPITIEAVLRWARWGVATTRATCATDRDSLIGAQDQLTEIGVELASTGGPDEERHFRAAHLRSQGMILLRLGEYKEAVTSLETSLRMSASRDTYFHLAATLRAQIDRAAPEERSLLESRLREHIKACRDLDHHGELEHELEVLSAGIRMGGGDREAAAGSR